MIGVVTNPNAKGVVRDPLLSHRLAAIGGRSTLVVETRDLAELQQAMKEFAAQGVDIVAACGGDGTNLAVLTTMIQAYSADKLPAFAILRGGTVNTVAANLGVKGHPEDILSRLVACRQRGMVEPVEVRPLLCVNGSYGFLFGSAMASRFFEAYYNGPATGLVWASFLAARITFSSLLGTKFSRWLFQPMVARVTVDGKVLPQQQWTLLVASTLMNVGLQIRITYRALERDGHFHLIASGMSPSYLARQIHKTFLARPLKGEPHFDLLPKEVIIEFERPEAYIMDGDLFHAERVVVTNGPRVRLCSP